MAADTEPRDGRILIPRAVFDGLEAVRRSGRTNMLDRRRVAQLACEMGFEDAAAWITANRDLYARGIFQGFEVVGAPAGS